MGGPKDGGCLNCKRKSIKITFRKPSCLSENDQRALSKTAALGSVLATLVLRNFRRVIARESRATLALVARKFRANRTLLSPIVQIS